MKKCKKIEYIVVVVIAFLFVCSLTASEVRWFKLNDPQGNFSDVSSYIAHGRLPSRVSKVVKEGKTFYIAFGPLPIDDIWLALPSGPAAYVFDESGKLVQWSKDSGDDSQFSELWLKSQQKKSSLEELKQLGFQQNIQQEVLNPRP